MSDKQRIRNELSGVEDDARLLRKMVKSDGLDSDDVVKTLSLIARLAQIVREDIIQ